MTERKRFSVPITLSRESSPADSKHRSFELKFMSMDKGPALEPTNLQQRFDSNRRMEPQKFAVRRKRREMEIGLAEESEMELLSHKELEMMVRVTNGWQRVLVCLKNWTIYLRRQEQREVHLELSEIYHIGKHTSTLDMFTFQIITITGTSIELASLTKKEGVLWVGLIRHRMRAFTRNPEAYKEGNMAVLNKRGQWECRWIVLNRTTLTVLHNAADTSGGDTMALEDVVDVSVKAEQGHPYCLEITYVDRILLLSAMDSTLQCDWEEAITARVNGMKELICWGNNDYGKLGFALDRDRIAVPLRLDDFHATDIVCIACGENHSAAALEDGRLFTWGSGSQGQLGHGNSEDLDEPRAVTALDGICVLSVACAADYTLALTFDGEVYLWGNTRAIDDDNCAMYWMPFPYRHLRGAVVREISASSTHVIAVTDAAMVYTWGQNFLGQLGSGDKIHRSQPHLVSFPKGLRGEDVWSVAAGDWHSAAVTESGLLFTWGSGPLGYPSQCELYPRLVDAIADVDMISCGRYHMGALRFNGELWMWGKGEVGQMGLGPKNISVKTPQKVDGLGTVSIGKFSCGIFHTAAVARTGGVWVWGDARFLGLSLDKNQFTPQEIKSVWRRTGDVACGKEHTLSVAGRHRWLGWTLQQTLLCSECESQLVRIHRCRICLRAFCVFCVSVKIPLPERGYFFPIRMCASCNKELTRPNSIQTTKPPDSNVFVEMSRLEDSTNIETKDGTNDHPSDSFASHGNNNITEESVANHNGKPKDRDEDKDVIGDRGANDDRLQDRRIMAGRHDTTENQTLESEDRDIVETLEENHTVNLGIVEEEDKHEEHSGDSQNIHDGEESVDDHGKEPHDEDKNDGEELVDDHGKEPHDEDKNDGEESVDDHGKEPHDEDKNDGEESVDDHGKEPHDEDKNDGEESVDDHDGEELVDDHGKEPHDEDKNDGEPQNIHDGEELVDDHGKEPHDEDKNDGKLHDITENHPAKSEDRDISGKLEESHVCHNGLLELESTHEYQEYTSEQNGDGQLEHDIDSQRAYPKKQVSFKDDAMQLPDRRCDLSEATLLNILFCDPEHRRSEDRLHLVEQLLRYQARTETQKCHRYTNSTASIPN